jgi:DNA-binding SARP family transcriptional activator
VLSHGSHRNACVQLLSSFACRVGGSEVVLAELPRGLITGLALAERRMPRAIVAERLWPRMEPTAAAKRLRQTLWRIRRLTADHVVQASQDTVAITEGVRVDVEEAEGLARRILSPGVADDELTAIADWAPLGLPLLPEHAGEAVHLARQRWDRLRLLALERLAEANLAQGRIPDAIELASRAMAIDDLNEGLHRLLVRANLARRDIATAKRIHAGYTLLLRRTLDVEPSAEFRSILATFR